MPGLVSAGGKRPVWKGRLVYTAIMMKTIRVGSRLLDLQRPVVMAIINVTPDSFFAGSRTPEVRAVRERVHKAVAEGASIIDVGGYSSRPGAADVPPAEELRRVSLAVEVIRNEYPEMAVSVDTFRASVAEGVISRFGPCIVNDISAGELDAAGVLIRFTDAVGLSAKGFRPGETHTRVATDQQRARPGVAAAKSLGAAAEQVNKTGAFNIRSDRAAAARVEAQRGIVGNGAGTEAGLLAAIADLQRAKIDQRTTGPCVVGSQQDRRATIVLLNES